MCGVAGYFLRREEMRPVATILDMTRAVAHRGPDDEGLVAISVERATCQNFITDETARGVPAFALAERGARVPHQVAFGHRRFSIIDLSPGGHQPLWRDSVCVALNGEIYNYVALREQLEARGHRFTTASDTDVLAAAYLEWGPACFERFVGFWALSLYDARTGTVLLSRDRVGKAPLYIASTPEGCFWASDIAGVMAGAGGSFPVRDEAVHSFARHALRDVFHQTFYRNIVSFPNAAWAQVDADGVHAPRTFWTLPIRRMTETDVDAAEAAKELRNLITDALQLRRHADVPVGFELSGGADSSSLVALAGASGQSLRAFTMSTPGTATDEEPFARSVVEHYRGLIDYDVLRYRDEDFLDAADTFVAIMEEPFHSPNILTNQQIWRAMSAAGVRVSINGAAGDEVFAGYAADYHAPYLRSLLRRGRLGAFLHEFSSLSERRENASLIEQLQRAYHLLPERARVIRSPAVLLHPLPDPLVGRDEPRAPDGPSAEIGRRLLDLMGHWRMNYWLRSGNKASMAVPVEVRAPFLDHRVVDFAFRLPVSYLIRDGWMKWILRQALSDSLPPEVVWRRRKVGFPYPYRGWFASSRERVFAVLGRLDCPYIDLRRLRAGYDELSLRDPLYLWRLVSIALWWKRCVLGERLA